jgi:hypothetical protein
MAPKAMPTAQVERQRELTASMAADKAWAEAFASTLRKQRALESQAQAAALTASTASTGLGLPRQPFGAGAALAARAAQAVAASPSATPAFTRPAWIAWNTPPRMRMGDSAEVEVRLRLGEASAPPTGLQARITASGSTRTEAAELGQEVDVSIDTTAFGLSPTGVQRQRLSAQRDAVLRWTIQPREAGSHVLLLRVVPVLPAGSPDPAPWVQPFAATILVEVDRLGSLLGFISSNWQPLLTLVILPLLLWWRKSRQAKN